MQSFIFVASTDSNQSHPYPFMPNYLQNIMIYFVTKKIKRVLKMILLWTRKETKQLLFQDKSAKCYIYMTYT